MMIIDDALLAVVTKMGGGALLDYLLKLGVVEILSSPILVKAAAKAIPMLVTAGATIISTYGIVNILSYTLKSGIVISGIRWGRKMVNLLQGAIKDITNKNYMAAIFNFRKLLIKIKEQYHEIKNQEISKYEQIDLLIDQVKKYLSEHRIPPQNINELTEIILHLKDPMMAIL